MREWYTCIVFVGIGHINPVQYFHTRAENVAGAKANAEAWFKDEQWVDKDMFDVPFVFKGKLEREKESDQA